MTARELRDLLVSYCERHPRESHENEVMVETKNGGCPTMYFSHVVIAATGGDWTKGMFILRTADRLVVENNITEPLADLAAQRLADLDSTIIGGPRVAKNQRRAWIDGFCYGVRAHYTGPEGKGV